MKDHLKVYLQEGRNALLWKLDGLGEYDIRRPLTRTATNLLGLVKHAAGVESDYLGVMFGRPFPEPLPCIDDDAEPNADMWATADESRDPHRPVPADLGAFGRHHRGPRLDAPARCRGGRRAATSTLHRILVHLIDETPRHAGQADLVRESIDGLAGLSRRQLRPARVRPELVGRLPGSRRTGRARSPGPTGLLTLRGVAGPLKLLVSSKVLAVSAPTRLPSVTAVSRVGVMPARPAARPAWHRPGRWCGHIGSASRRPAAVPG